MINILQLFFILLFSIVAPNLLFAQNTSFSIVPNTISIKADENAVENVAKANVKNLSNTTKTLRWQRIVKNISEGWENAVCDKNACWSPIVSQRELTLNPGESSNIDIHVYPNGKVGAATVIVEIKDLSDTTNVLRGSYCFNQTCTTTSTIDMANIDSKVYPNPSSDYIFINNNDIPIKNIIVYNAIGNIVKSFDNEALQAQNRYDVSDLPNGFYFISLINKENASIIATTPFFKINFFSFLKMY